MPTFGDKSEFELEGSEASHLKSLNDRFVRWQEKQVNLLTFSINLLFTISIATIGIILNNFDDALFKNKIVYGFSLPKTTVFIITISTVLGIVALFCRLFDFRFTKTTIRYRTLLFKLKNKIKYEHCKELTESELENKIKELTCKTDLLGKATWLFFYIQTISFLIAIILIVYKI